MAMRFPIHIGRRARAGLCERCGGQEHVHRGLCHRCRGAAGSRTFRSPSAVLPPRPAQPEPLRNPPWRRRGA